MMLLFKKLIIVSSLFFSTSFAYAAINATIESFPEFPKAYDAVTLTLKSYSFDTDLAKITWKVDGKIVSSGYGLKSLKVTAKGTGEVSVVQVSVVLPNNDTVSLDFILSPQSIDLVWEAAESYTPPFYEGKTLPGEGSLIRVVAFPSFVENGVGVPPTSVAYTWTVNDSVVPSASGMGKQTLTTRLDYLSDSSVVKVVARTAGGSFAEERITITPNDISPLFYKHDPILGTDLSITVGKRIEVTKEVSLKLEPFFISQVVGSDSGESYLWTIDGLPVTTQTPTMITLRPKEKSYGVKTISVLVENTKRRLQQTKAVLEVVFDTR